MTTHVTPLSAVTRGLAAGVAGTALMTIAQELSAKLQAADDDQSDAAQGGGDERDADPWQQASTPAKVARRISEGVFGHEIPADRIPLLTNATHWGYGTAWGAAYGLLAGTFGSSMRRGLAFGSGVWVMSYVQLVPMGLYEPPWKYAPKDMALEVSYHLAYGLGVGAGYGLLARALP